MKGKKLWIVIALLATVVLVIVIIQSKKERTAKQTASPENRAIAESRSTSPLNHPMNPETSRVPAHYEVAPASAELSAVLPAAQFTGKTREAYEAAKQIPVMLAQMPCYCHCDRGMGHKSLHSCFEDDHAAHCATCVDEALMTYRLQKKGLSADQIRKQIIAEFGD
ncbi:MAG TPA: CYCXC family (seleno)protein [Pyrinomonadaceae bacterium]|nr:CYCXC family (seleno)protein [Pyrinomonadaceae bacterium]